MNVTTERQGGVLFVLVSGRIDGGNVAAFEEAVRTAFESRDRAVIMDLEKLSYINSAGLRVLLMVANNLSGSPTKFALCAMSDRIRHVIETGGLDKVIPVLPSKAEALASLDS